MEAIHYIAIAGIAVALFMGVKSSWDAKRLQEKQFRDNEEIRRKEHRNALLDETIKWAEDVLTCGIEYVQPDSLLINSLKLVRDMTSYESESAGRFELAYLLLKRRGRYIANIASILDKKLHSNVELLRKEIKVRIDMYDKQRLTFIDMNDDLEQFRAYLLKSSQEIGGQMRSILKVANKIIDRACDLKTTERS